MFACLPHRKFWPHLDHLTERARHTAHAVCDAAQRAQHTLCQMACNLGQRAVDHRGRQEIHCY